MKIGLFDSGIGGISVLKKLTYINGAHYIYIADTERAPYGLRTSEALESFVWEFVDFFHKKKVNEIFAACNTTDSIILENNLDLVIKYNSIIRAGVSAAKSSKVGVIGTNVTIKNGSYRRYLEVEGKEVYQKATQLFVSLVEEGVFYGRMVEAIANYYLLPLKKENVKELILGCTHFPFLKGIISRVLPKVRIIDPAEELSKLLVKNNTRRPFVEFYVTGDPKEFERKLKRINFRVAYTINKFKIRKVVSVEKFSGFDGVVRSG
ncbi:glutamate racemase [Thermosipho melanesiensis]|uniref:Glutamate racemase n=2 Tax=Thermosipho melanesiensis TaxID=46541 RepID=A6LMR8_THEM4|nr:glutamate racemase [Thermosipho melanesiensis]ABR31219.1 glutamate racemase [Thermosipho melanesiensis BI429]APT74303.1 glutamate racemase [Thermosipho melanesiensis]OOC36244.1 glutamate racemase [Thermosipho melanesiensis]OOC37062.1 glutamate racemase [Thermosipho melanesiensis]OOC37814.1 glutamate racemase [Thermosipho melanesiensis]